jgi:glycosyltransferase involved in cell wall biosynthesis
MPPETITLFYHGTLSPNRGLDHVIQGIALLGPAERERLRLVIVGDGPDATRLRNLAVSEGIAATIEFRGLVPYEDVPNHIQESNCCICPLPNRPEWNVSSPLKVFEYMAAGKPMILTPIPAHRDVLTDSRFVVWTNAAAAQDFATAIRAFLANRGPLETAAALEAPVRAQDHTWTNLAARLANHLEVTFGKTA